MGLFKKLFSISSKRFKKRSAVEPCTEPPVLVDLKSSNIDDTEAAVSRLLRSSSGRCTTEPQIGLDSLPRLSHPIDSVIPPPKSSSTTLASVSARSAYSVTIRSRIVHSRTEFPNAYPPMDVTFTPKRSLTDSARRRSKSVPITPRDRNRLLTLRQDPSVASLINHYDDEGHLDSALFSNTPSPRNGGGIQRRRTGSTLRQLLGHPSSPELGSGGAEGDISWAEKYLGSVPDILCRPSAIDEALSETDGNSSTSSIGPQTPADTHSIDDKTAHSIECDTSSPYHPTFSSLEVELSTSTDPDTILPQVPNSPYANSMSHQRASQIFGFLGDKKRAYDGQVSRLPQLKTTASHYRRFSTESSTSDTKHSHISLHRRYSTHIPQLTSPTSQKRYSFASDTSRSPPSPTAAAFLSPRLEDQESVVLQPVINQHTGQCNCCPRGLDSPCKIPLRQIPGPVLVPYKVDDSCPATEQPTQTDNKCVSVAASRSRGMHSQIPKLRTPSGSSSSSAGSNYDSVISSPHRHPISLRPGVQMKPRPTGAEFAVGIAPHIKENDVSRLPQPVTPIRPFGVHLHEVPSPASSSELSPVAKQMMANLRQQRMHARQEERRAGRRLGNGQSRVRY